MKALLSLLSDGVLVGFQFSPVLSSSGVVCNGIEGGGSCETPTCTQSADHKKNRHKHCTVHSTCTVIAAATGDGVCILNSWLFVRFRLVQYY